MTESINLPSRLHHNARVTNDQEMTRKFYEDLLGFPLVATWCEKDILFGKERIYCHTFFAIGDGGALAFFQFADPDDQAQFNPELPKSPFNHIAFKTTQADQERMERRLQDAGYEDPQFFVLEHGYCRSMYIEDPNGLLLEFVVDHPDADKIIAERRVSAHADLARWLAGDHGSNNTYRP